jgi:hydrogenase maturation protein HypF
MDVRRKIEVSGIVQGVGFRPYVFRLATEQQLRGTVRNNSDGVVIEVQGPAEAVSRFLERLPAEAPPLSRITEIVVEEILVQPLELGGPHFRIIHSQTGKAVRTLISPDVSVCPDCLHEMFDPADRRYRYPFINCTNCGPRFTIVRSIPYDRPYTSMSVFPMCAACQAEYDDPLNRRFHAQPNACWDCGPQLKLVDRNGEKVSDRDPILEALRALSKGHVLAVKGLGGFHLAVDATNATAVSTLRERKHRVEKPFAVMVPNIEAARQFCEVDDASAGVLQSVQRPIVLLPKKADSTIVNEVAPFSRYLGVFLPYTPIHYLLMREGGLSALVMTSGNLSEEPIAINNEEALERLHDLADCFLIHNREILLRCDDSVVRVTSAKTRHLRRSRGFVPVPIFLKEDQPEVLAVGGELKNTICLTKGKHAFLSQHIGDLENQESYGFFNEAINHLKNILEIEPQVIAYDLHPDYFSTKWAQQQAGVPTIGVQHHHAHIASCMTENHLDGQVIGFALDGTGYGTDGQIWGGELLIGGYEGFERTAHFEYMPLPGGAMAIHEPWRMAVSYLAHHFGDDFLKLDIPFVRQLDRKKTDLLLRMIKQKINSPLTSSCGRLFDAVAAVIGVRQQVNYEAQAAIELEMSIDREGDDEAYPFDVLNETKPWKISTKPVFEALIADLKLKVPTGAISRRFHNGLVQTFVSLATDIRSQSGLNRVCLSGGTFHNIYLSEELEAELSLEGFEVYSQRDVPAGDGGLSLGQALIAAHQFSKKAP